VGGDVTAAVCFLVFGVVLVVAVIIAETLTQRNERRRMRAEWDEQTIRLREQWAQIEADARETMFGRDA
jgi:sensor domain CHASE-containing protein